MFFLFITMGCHPSKVGILPSKVCMSTDVVELQQHTAEYKDLAYIDTQVFAIANFIQASSDPSVEHNDENFKRYTQHIDPDIFRTMEGMSNVHLFIENMFDTWKQEHPLLSHATRNLMDKTVDCAATLQATVDNQEKEVERLMEKALKLTKLADEALATR